MKRTVTVLQDDIDRGCVKQVHNCAIARAAKRDLADLLGEKGFAEAAPSRLFIYPAAEYLLETKDILEARLPAEAQSFIACFDSGLPVAPFKFEIELGPLAGEYIS